MIVRKKSQRKQRQAMEKIIHSPSFPFMRRRRRLPQMTVRKSMAKHIMWVGTGRRDWME